jgi:hypothetical protein
MGWAVRICPAVERFAREEVGLERLTILKKLVNSPRNWRL